jgi:hypothetical protein
MSFVLLGGGTGFIVRVLVRVEQLLSVDGRVLFAVK